MEGSLESSARALLYFDKESSVCFGATSSLRNWELVSQPGHSFHWNMPRILPGLVRSLLALPAGNKQKLVLE